MAADHCIFSHSEQGVGFWNGDTAASEYIRATVVVASVRIRETCYRVSCIERQIQKSCHRRRAKSVRISTHATDVVGRAFGLKGGAIGVMKRASRFRRRATDVAQPALGFSRIVIESSAYVFIIVTDVV